MYFLSLFDDPLTTLMRLIAIVLAVTIHEFCHAKAADMLGDPTPSSMDRVTLNPLAHLDPLGSILFLLVGFGWGKPVPFDPFNLQNPKRDGAIIAFAGPASNFVIAGLLAVVSRLVPLSELAYVFVAITISINVILGIFNLLPFAPLDGFRVVGGLLNEDQARDWYSLERYGIFFLMFFILPFAGGRSMLEIFITPVIQGVLSVLISPF